MMDDGEYSLFRMRSTKYPLVKESMMKRFFKRNAPNMVVIPPPLPRPNKPMFLPR